MCSTSIKKQPQSAIGLLRLVLVLIGILAGGYVSIGAAVAEIYKNANPSTAAPGWPKNGFALNAVADEKVNEAASAASKFGKTGITQDNPALLQSISSIALQSFRLEPLNTSALRSLALVSEAKGDAKLAKNLMADAIKFSRRDTAANNWQLQQALKAQDLPASMRLLDRLLREDDSSQLNYIPALIAGVSQPEGMNALLPLLLKQPLWEQQFWSMAAVQPNIPAELALLRQKLLTKRRQKLPMASFLDADVYLIQNLIQSNQLDAAKSLHDFLTRHSNSIDQSKVDHRILNGFKSFGSPFDWQFESKSEAQAYLNDAGDGLILEIDSNSLGVFARNLVRSETGQFNVKIFAKPEPDIVLFLRFKCVETANPIPAVTLVLDNKYSLVRKMKASSCNWFSIEILGQNKSQNNAMLSITNIEVYASLY